MGLLGRIFERRQDDTALALYNAVVAEARQPHWYLEGGVPDTVDGRFDMIAAVLAMVLLRLEDEGEAAAMLSARLTERFVTDMDGQMREIGIGDLLVGKHVGGMMAMLGGRIGAYREGLLEGTLDAALVRNLYRSATPNPPAVAHTRDMLTARRAVLRDVPVTALAEGVWP